MIKKLTLKVDARLEGRRLDHALAEWLPQALGKPISRARARALIIAGAVYLNGKRVRIASKELRGGAQVDAYVDPSKLETGAQTADRPFEMKPESILFEDEDLIAVNKPPGLPTQPTLDDARSNLFASVKKFLAARSGVVDPYLALHHRLDRDTSGVLLLAKTKRVNAGVAELFTKHLAQKTYNAISSLPRSLPESWQVSNFLGRAPGSGKRSRFASVKSGGDPALTDFRVLERFAHACWIEAKPRTGRTHQIRVHLSEGGAPILGDSLYGGRNTEAPRLMLHALNLTFPHPITKVETSIHSPLPEDFNRCLTQLREAKPRRD